MGLKIQMETDICCKTETYIHKTGNKTSTFNKVKFTVGDTHPRPGCGFDSLGGTKRTDSSMGNGEKMLDTSRVSMKKCDEGAVDDSDSEGNFQKPAATQAGGP